METLSIKSKKPFALKPLEKILLRHWPVEASTDNTLVVHGTTTRAYLYPDPESKSAEEFGLFLDYADVELAKSILEKIADDFAVTFDNDFGTVLPGDQFVARCKSERGWDWRR